MADVDSSKLKPCPFCGGPALFHKDDDCDGCHYIECQSCKGMFDLATKADPYNQAESLEELIPHITVVWNTRPAEAALLLKVAELELLADDARGKRCPECSAPMVSLSTIDGGQRVCSGCDKVWSWHLKEGQPPLIGNNRMVKKV